MEHKLAEILRAIAEGAEIEGREVSGIGQWHKWPDIDDLTLNPLTSEHLWEWRRAPLSMNVGSTSTLILEWSKLCLLPSLMQIGMHGQDVLPAL